MTVHRGGVTVPMFHSQHSPGHGPATGPAASVAGRVLPRAGVRIRELSKPYRILADPTQGLARTTEMAETDDAVTSTIA